MSRDQSRPAAQRTETTVLGDARGSIVADEEILSDGRAHCIEIRVRHAHRAQRIVEIAGVRRIERRLRRGVAMNAGASEVQIGDV